jgi:hypothetical protein
MIGHLFPLLLAAVAGPAAPAELTVELQASAALADLQTPPVAAQLASAPQAEHQATRVVASLAPPAHESQFQEPTP